VDVVVTDRSGERVHGLAVKDFELFDNGVAQDVSNFSEFRREAQGPAIEQVESAAAPPPRRIVIVLDDVVLHGITIGKLSSEIDRLIDTLDDRDQMMIVEPALRQKVVQPFTNDQSRLKRAMREILRASSFRATSALGREQRAFDADVMNPENDKYSLPNGVRMYAGVVALRVKQMLGYVQAVCGALAEVEGKKAVIIISQSLPAEPGREAWPMLAQNKSGANLNLSDRGKPAVQSTGNLDPQTVGPWSYDSAVWQNLRPMIEDVARTASTNGITIYSLQPEIPMGAAFEVAAESSGKDVNTGQRDTVTPPNVRVNVLSEQMAMTQSTFTSFADATGGSWFRGGRGVGAAFNAIAADLGDYYSLGYHAPEAAADKPRQIEVRVKGHGDLTVRARRDVIRKSPSEEMRDRTVANLVVPSQVDELGIAAIVGKPRREAGIIDVPIEVRVPLKNLTLLPDGDVYRGSFRVHVASTGEHGDFASGEAKEQLVEVPRAQLAMAQKKFWSYVATIRAKPGPIRVAIGVLDPVSKLSSYRTLTIDTR
jgi:VWFA-related protein